MSEANSTQIALQNLREFKEMSYSDVYSLIREKRFVEAKAKYSSVLETMECGLFASALELTITTPHDDLLIAMSNLAASVSEPEKIKAVGFDFSAHEIYHDEGRIIGQGIEISLYSEDVYAFATASDEELTNQCEAVTSDWQGYFMDVAGHPLEGLGAVAKEFSDYLKGEVNHSGILNAEETTAVVDEQAIALHVAKLLVAIEYHRYMADFIVDIEVPDDMVFIIGEHDEIEVPIVFYRISASHQNAIIEEADAQNEGDVAQNEVDAPAMYDEVAHEIQQQIEDNEVVEVAEYVKDIEDKVIVSDTQNEFIDSIDNKEVEALGEGSDEAISSAQSLLGKPLTAKAFGQRSNEVFNDSKVATNVEKQAV